MILTELITFLMNGDNEVTGSMVLATILASIFHFIWQSGALTTCSPPALTSSAVMLLTPADFPFSNAITATSISPCRMAKSSFIWGSS